jgi:chromosome partitioning protein
MGKIIAVTNGKGGVGKSNTAQHLSIGLKKQGYSVLLVDTDIQRTTTKWRSKIDDDDYLNVISLPRPTLHKDLKPMKSAFDFIIIDGASKVEEIVTSGIRAADVVIIPLKHSGADVDALDEPVKLIKDRQSVTDGLPQAFFLINADEARTKLSKNIHLALERFKIPLLKSRISHSTYYMHTASQGGTVYDMPGAEFKAKAQEFDNFIDELKGRING